MTRDYVESKLIDIGIPSNLKGFTYIADAVILLDRPEWNNPKWTALYYSIAQLNSTNSACVERNIRHAFMSCRNRNIDIDTIQYYIGLGNEENSSSLSQLHQRLKSENNILDFQMEIERLVMKYLA